MSLIKRKFNFTSDGEDHDATVDETSEVLESCYNYTWSITPEITGIVGGPPIYTIEVSNDGVNWFNYSSSAVGVSVVNALDDTHLAFTKMRVKHEANGTTDGSVTYSFTQKSD